VRGFGRLGKLTRTNGQPKEITMSMYKNLTATERKSHFRNLVSLAARDGVIRDEESAVLGYVAGKWKLTDAEIKEVTANPNAITASFPTDRATCFHQLYDIVEMMIIDGDVRKVERELCTALAVKLGFAPDAVNVVIKGILEGNLKMMDEKDIHATLMKQLA
jgi:uncharacterized tellurite resistance protein B-like protein